MSEPVAKNRQEPSVLRAASFMGAATFMSRILGLVREQVFAVLFGAGNAMDAFIIAFRIPNLLRDLFAEGAMSASFVPVFTRTRIEEGERRAWRVAGLVFRVLFVAVGILALLGIVFAPEIVSLYASAFKAVPGKFELTVKMTRVIFPFFPLVALAAAFMGILNACGYYFLPAFSSALFNLGSIVVGTAITLFLRRYGGQWGIEPIEGMAIGVVVGGLVQALSQVPAIYRAGYRWEKRLPEEPRWREDPALRRMLGMMIPGTVGLAATQLSILINSVLATSQGTGAASWLSYAFRLMQFPIGIFGVSMAAAVLPRVSRLWVEKDLAGVEETLTRSLRQVFAVNLPASAGLAFLGYPIIELIFQYGRFQPSDTEKTAFALAMYAIGLTAYSAVKVLVPACYAMGNTRVAVISSAVSVFSTIVLNLLMVGPFGYWGLALGTSVGAMVNLGFLLFAVRKLVVKQGGSFGFGSLASAFAQHLGVALLMGLLCAGSHYGLNQWLPDAKFVEFFGKTGLVLGRSLKVGVVMVEGMALVLILAHLFRVRDTTEVAAIFFQKLKKKLSRPRT